MRQLSRNVNPEAPADWRQIGVALAGLRASCTDARSTVSQCAVSLGCCAMLVAGRLCAAESLVFPKALERGDTIAFVSPARAADDARMQLAATRLRAMGFVVRTSRLRAAGEYFGGSDAERAAELMAAFTDDSVAAVFPVTGGFGSTRILDCLDYAQIRRHPKILIGFSDITGLHLAIHKQSKLVTFHSPNPDGGLGTASNLTPFASHWFFRAIMADRFRAGASRRAGYEISGRLPGSNRTLDANRPWDSKGPVQPPVTLVSGRAKGRLIGGNLSLITALMGTPYEIETENRILFLEDIGEAPYRVDRMLSTLRLAGKLDNPAAVVLGVFTRRADEDLTTDGLRMNEVLDGYFGSLGVPVVKGFPLGHQPANATLPIGVMAEVDGDSCTVRLLEDPVRWR